MRRRNEDKLDEMIRENNLKANLIKWWNVEIKMPDPSPEEDDDDVFSDENTAIYDSILKDNRRDEDPYEKAMKKVEKDKKEEAEQGMLEANEIYARLMREAQEDEEKKKREVEELKKRMGEE